VPGAYSEDAALKAYPKCETVPCDDYEAAFEVPLFLITYGVVCLMHLFTLVFVFAMICFVGSGTLVGG